MYKIRKSLLLSFFVTLASPIIGVIIAFRTISQKNETKYFLVISIFVFSVLCYVPPYQDLYRRYTLNFLAYNNATTYLDVIKGHVDIVMYVTLLFFKKNGIPFFIYPALQSAIIIFMYLAATRDVLNQIEASEKYRRTCYILVFLMVNLLGAALTLRYAFAVGFLIRAISLWFFTNKRKRSIIYLVLSAFTHFSMLFPIAVLIGSSFVRISKKKIPFLAIIAFLCSSVALKYILNNINLGGINEYASSGYVDGGFANTEAVGNAIIVSIYRYAFDAFFFFIYWIAVYDDERKLNKFLNFINVYLVACFFIAISVTAFNRYLNNIGSYLMFIAAIIYLKDRSKSLKFLMLTGLVVINFIFQDIYLQRRPIALANLWEGLYTPSFNILLYSDDDFNAYLKHIDRDGDWIGHELGGPQ